ncbi:hypothetical protein FSP39_023888 [Pinctada imbricata]|uniref:B box-type domain-containing protein n=1 Tax=Pinctada imbricata TaxID=66713 RepID=A0AA89BTM9_PINIB|nr:hypothetical protein FSP39_023888 [Pinctada imbricata]
MISGFSFDRGNGRGRYPPIKFPQTTVECEGCGAEFDVTWFCKNCSASLCKTCKEEHAREKFLKKHEVVPRTGSVLWTHGSWKLKESCLKHDRELVTFCNDCNQPCCINCIQEHPRHSFVTLENNILQLKLVLNSFVNDLIMVLLPTIQNDMSVLKQKIDSCTDNFEKAKSEVDSFFDSMKKVLEQSRAEMKSKLTKTQEQCRIALSEVLKLTENDMKAVQSIISVVERRIRAGGLDLITYYPKVPKYLPILICLLHCTLCSKR